MQVHSVRTEHFRLLENQLVEFAPGVNVITGENAQGKTTLLEAVYLLTGVKSFRTRFPRRSTPAAGIRPWSCCFKRAAPGR